MQSQSKGLRVQYKNGAFYVGDKKVGNAKDAAEYDGLMNYILAPDKIKTGDEIISGRNKEIKIGNCMPLCDIPAGTDIHNIELFIII